MMARTLIKETTMEYIQNANTMSNMPVSILVAMLGARVKLTEAPWCNVFHHCTEK